MVKTIFLNTIDKSSKGGKQNGHIHYSAKKIRKVGRRYV